MTDSEGASNNASTVRKQRDTNADACLAQYVFIQFRIPVHGIMPPTLGLYLSTSINWI